MSAICDECWNDNDGVIFEVEVITPLREEAPLKERKLFHLDCLPRYMWTFRDKAFQILRRLP